MKRVLITGASGFIGQTLRAKLLERGYSVTALTHESGDIADPETFAKLGPTSIVFHLAGRSYVPDSWAQSQDFLRVNVLGTQNVIDFCKKNKAKLIFASAYIYGQPTNLPICEQHPINPTNPYALSKHLSEQLCFFAGNSFGLDVSILRIFNVYGPGQRSEFLIPTIFKQIISGRGIILKDATPRRDYIYVDDVVDAFIRAGDIAAGVNVFNIGSGVSYSVAELVGIVQSLFETSYHVRYEEVARTQEIPDVIANTRHALNILNWSPKHTIETGLNMLMRSYTKK